MRFGARALQESAPPGHFNRVLSFAIWLDVLSALAAGLAIVLAMGTVVAWLNMPAGLAEEARIYGTCVVFVALSSSAEALLRLFERFDLVAARNVIAPSIQVVGSALAFVVGGGLTFFLAVWFAAYAIARLTLIGMALWELRRRRRLHGVSLHPSYLAGPEPGAWRFAAATNAMNILGKVREHGTTFIVGALLDPAAVGLVHIAQRLGKMPRKPVSKILTPAFFPEIAHQTASGKHRKRHKTVWRSTLVVGAFGALLFTVLALFGRTLLAVLFGPAFSEAYPVMLLFAAGSLVGTITFAVRPVLLSAGRVRILLATGISMAILRVGLLFVLIPQVGLSGAALAELIAAVMASLVVVPAARQELRRPRDAVPLATSSDTHSV
jgi:O-antigen/teichoic acid export membrane protein